MENTSGITSVYLGMLRKIFYFLAAAAAVIAAGLLIVYPVWFFAVNYPSGYSVSLILLAVLALLSAAAVKLYKKQLTVKSLIFITMKIIYILVLVCGAGAVAVLYMNSLIFQGSVIMTVLFLVTGIIVHLNRKQEK